MPERQACDPEPQYLADMYGGDSNFFMNLNGMFHGLVADRARGIISLFNDRYGMHRLCYHESPDCFYFASEAKAILAVCQELRVGDPRGIGEFVTCSCVLENRTIFKDIHVLPAASNWTFRNGHCESKNTYFTPSEWEAQELLSEQAYYEELRSTLFEETSVLLHRQAAFRHCHDRRTRHAGHPGLPSAITGVASQLYLRKYVSRFARCTNRTEDRWASQTTSYCHRGRE